MTTTRDDGVLRYKVRIDFVLEVEDVHAAAAEAARMMPGIPNAPGAMFAADVMRSGRTDRCPWGKATGVEIAVDPAPD